MQTNTNQRAKSFGVALDSNKGKRANAKNNKRYFDTTTRYASAQLIVDDKHILQTMPLLEVGYHVGGRNYTDFGKELMKGYSSPNYVCIGVEVCVNSDGDFEKAYDNAVSTFASLLIRFGMFTNHITTHHRITGKDCPQFPDEAGIFHLIEDERFDKFIDDVEMRFWDMTEETYIPFE